MREGLIERSRCQTCLSRPYEIDAGNYAEVRELGQWIPALRQQVGHVEVGQKYLVDRLLLGLLANGHLLLEGVPGLAKTLTVKTMAAGIQTGFQRLQFTPDLLPADLIGTLIYNPRTGEFTTKLGPIFSNLILADEINRAPAKVQSALLEAMQERQVTIGEQTYPLPIRSWFSRLKTQSNRKARTNCLRRNSIVSCSS